MGGKPDVEKMGILGLVFIPKKPVGDWPAVVDIVTVVSDGLVRFRGPRHHIVQDLRPR